MPGRAKLCETCPPDALLPSLKSQSHSVTSPSGSIEPVPSSVNDSFSATIAGYAAAIAYVLLVVILILTVIQLWVGKRMVYYAS